MLNLTVGNGELRLAKHDLRIHRYVLFSVLFSRFSLTIPKTRLQIKQTISLPSFLSFLACCTGWSDITVLGLAFHSCFSFVHIHLLSQRIFYTCFQCEFYRHFKSPRSLLQSSPLLYLFSPLFFKREISQLVSQQFVRSDIHRCIASACQIVIIALCVIFQTIRHIL